MDPSYWQPRRSLRDAVPEIAEAQSLLDQAATAHLTSDALTTAKLLRAADLPAIREWTESIWGRHNKDILRERLDPVAPPLLPLAQRPLPRMPTRTVQRQVLKRDGYHCRFCAIPVIDRSIRALLHRTYPEAVPWGKRNSEQHAAFQCMWLQYDHLLPNGRGGDSSFANVVISCAPCNFGRMERTLAAVGVLSPAPPTFSAWDGLNRLLASS